MWEMKEGKYAKTLAKILVTAIFLMRDTWRNFLPKFNMPLGTARLPTPKCFGNERISRSKCIMDQNITRQREPGL